MAKFPPYRLQTLFDLKERDKKAAEDAFAEKQKEVIQEERKLAQMHQTLEGMIQARKQRKHEYAEAMRQGGISIHQIQGNDRHIDRMKMEEEAYQGDIDKQGEVLAEAQERAEEARQKMLEASQEFKALEKHKEKWLKGVKREMMLKEEDEADDIAQTQYFARQKEERERS